MEKHRLSIDGALDELRRRLREYVKTNPSAVPPGKRSATILLLPTSTGVSRGETSRKLPSPVIEVNRLNFFTPPATPGPVTGFADQARVMNQIHKWGCHFDGKNPVMFLERIKELHETYRVPRLATTAQTARNSTGRSSVVVSQPLSSVEHLGQFPRSVSRLLLPAPLPSARPTEGGQPTAAIWRNIRQIFYRAAHTHATRRRRLTCSTY